MLPYFSHWIEAFKGKTSDVVMFEQITDPLRQFSLFLFFVLSIISVAIFVFDHANHTRKKMKRSRVQWVSFHAQIAYGLKLEALVVRSI